MILAAAALALPAAAWAQALDASMHNFDIPPQPLSSALMSFSDQSGLQLTVSQQLVESLSTAGVSGSYSADEALRRLLAGSGLSYTAIDEGTVAISRPKPDAMPAATPASSRAHAPLRLAQADAASAATAPPVELQRTVVTGSRIARTGTTTPTPVTTIDAEALRLSGQTRLGDVLNEMPAIRATQTLGNVNSTDSASEAGTSFLNLRGLGIDRTLVLVDGRRQVGSRPGSAAADVNTIPSAMVERVEVITGGASAVYGADAVSGVINIITKKHFEGLRVDAQTGTSGEGDGERYQLSLTAGNNFGDDRGNVYFNTSWDRSQSAYASKRGWSSSNRRFAANPDNTGPDDGIPDMVLYDDTGYIGTPAGGQVVGPNGETFEEYGGPFTFDAAGNLVHQDQGNIIGPGLTQGGDYVDLSDYDLLAVPLERLIVSSGVTYDLSPSVQFFADARIAKLKAQNHGQPSFNLGSDASASGIPGAFITTDNPYVPPELLGILADEGLDGFYVGRTNADQGGRRAEADHDTAQLYLGLQGKLSDTINFTAHYQWGQTDVDTRYINERVNDRFLQQIDVVEGENGEPVCRDPSKGCVPLDILGPGAASGEASSFSQADFSSKGRLTQQVVQASVNGLTGLVLPAGAVDFAAGLEYRKEESETHEGYLRNSGILFGTGAVSDVTGDFDVSEIFAEVRVPLLRDLPFVQELSLEAAARYADYSTVGKATTWKLGGDWTVNDSLRLRSTVSQAVRAPNIGELYAAVEQSNVFLSDPCDVDYVNGGSANRAANCQALGLPVDFESNSGAFTRAVLSGGNEDLDEETADTFTVGFVLTPQMLDRFSLTLDYWDIDIDDAINSFPAQAVVNGCVDAGSIDNPLCDSVLRDDSGNIATVSSQLINIASFKARGVDLEAHYSYLLAHGGLLGFGLIGTYLDHLDFYAQDGEAPDREAGELGDPKWQLNLSTRYQYRALTLSLDERFISSQEYDLAESDELRSPNDTGSTWYTDLQVRYSFFSGAMDWYVGVDNVFDETPPKLATVPETRAFSSDAVIYNQLGRYFYSGLRYQF